MKPLLALSLTFLSFSGTAQIPGKSIAEYVTKQGTTFRKGDTLQLGLGTDIGGRFKYASVPPNLFVGTGTMPFNANYANQRMIIKDIRVQNMNKHMAPRTVAVVSSGGLNGSVDVDAAEEAGEIKTAANRSRAVVPSTGGVADELLKLKKLLDANVITQQEFDAQKAKLLK